VVAKPPLRSNPQLSLEPRGWDSCFNLGVRSRHLPAFRDMTEQNNRLPHTGKMSVCGVFTLRAPSLVQYAWESTQTKLLRFAH